MGDKATQRKLASYCKALGHPVRVQILAQLTKEGACQTGNLVDRLPLAQSTISEHLRILREAGLVTGEVDGPRRCYCVDAEALREMRRLLAEL